MYRTLPTLDCQTCGNCETNYHQNDEHNKHLGFCLRFKENVPLTEKNVHCWTNQENNYYKQLAIDDQKREVKNEHINNKKAKLLDINFPNQQFELF